MIRQIILITDGCSNVGISPVMAAAQAQAEEIVVNVVGVVEQGEIGSRGIEEIEQIARAGGGMCRIVPTSQLSQTVQMMTRKTVTHSIQLIVKKELKQILGSEQSLEDLPPEQRGKIVEVMDRMTESSQLRVALLVDASASMKPKLPAVLDTILDLGISLRAREGKSEISVMHFPKSMREGEEIQLDLDWTDDLAKMDNLFYKLNMKGTTPTGPAIIRCVRYMLYGQEGLVGGGTDSLLPGMSDTDGGAQAKRRYVE